VTTTQNDENVDETTAAVAETDVEQSEEQTADEIVDTTEESEGAADESEPEAAEPGETKRRVNWSRVLAYGVLPGLALILAMAAGFLKWQDSSVRDAELVRMESVQAAKDSTVAMLSYEPDTVEQQLGAARDLLTGEFRDAYTSLTNDVVIPGAKEKQISATATVPAAASVSADPNHAVVLVFVNQTVVIGDGAPTDTASSVRVGLDKIDGRWLISKFDPV
jgi:Mce-associated membrane protein